MGTGFYFSLSEDALISEISTIFVATVSSIVTYRFILIKNLIESKIRLLRGILILIFLTLSIRYWEFAIYIYLADKKLIFVEPGSVRMFSNIPLAISMVMLWMYLNNNITEDFHLITKTKNMDNSKSTEILSLIRSILSGLGAYLLGKSLFGHSIDNNFLQGISGAILSAGSIIWSILNKQVALEKISGAIRQIVSSLGGILVAWGKLSAQGLESITGLVVIVIPYIQAYLERRKSQQLDNNKISTAQLKK